VEGQAESKEEEKSTGPLNYLCTWKSIQDRLICERDILQSRAMPDMKLAKDPSVTSSHIT
jgi:hypothetical protein